MTFDDLTSFFNENIKGQDYNVMVIGNRNDLDFEALGKLGEVKELDVDYLFNYETKEEEQLEEQLEEVQM
jgi:hypothetical protein